MIYLIYGLIGWLAFSVLFFFYLVYRIFTKKNPIESGCTCPKQLPGQGYQPCGCGKTSDLKSPPRRP